MEKITNGDIHDTAEIFLFTIGNIAGAHIHRLHQLKIDPNANDLD